MLSTGSRTEATDADADEDTALPSSVTSATASGAATTGPVPAVAVAAATTTTGPALTAPPPAATALSPREIASHLRDGGTDSCENVCLDWRALERARAVLKRPGAWNAPLGDARTMGWRGRTLAHQTAGAGQPVVAGSPKESVLETRMLSTQEVHIKYST